MKLFEFSGLNELTFNSRRSPVVGREGMCASSQPLATAAGLEMLRKGGNAVDAAIAMAATLNVTEPGSTGLGGDCFALVYESQSRSVFALNGSGRAPAALTLERLKHEGLGEHLPPLHPYTITVPGACAGWCDLNERFGRLPPSTLFEPAIRLAEEGFPVAPLTAYYWQRGAEKCLNQAFNGRELTIDGRAPRAGEIFRNPGLARTLKVIAENGKHAFYQGEIGRAIVSAVQKAGGCLSETDLARHSSTWENPISIEYRGMRIWECPPNGQGLAALLALNLLAGFDMSSLPPLSAKRLHLQIEAMRLAFADAFRIIADPAFVPVPLELLLSREYAEQRRTLINPKRAAHQVEHGLPFLSSDTVYLCAVDGEGNGCSFINSNYMGFGTGIVPEGWGFSLQNRGHNFSLDPRHPNALAPGKRPYHTIIPALATHPNGDLFGVFGVMGGFMQPQGHLQVVSALLDDHLDPQAALDRPRFCIQADRSLADVALEEGIPSQIFEQLQNMGHRVELIRGLGRALFGRGQIILRDPQSGVLWGGSDPRADGCAMPLG
ncbi:MAG: gamma-glutamyltranspeptidase [Bellilinea sp.]|nr:MAG: gamma-glutamyltranspeptidase [Bellilinea sp.]